MSTPQPPARKRSSAILIATLLILAIIGFMWRGCWYGAPMSIESIRAVLADQDSEAGDIQKALNQLDGRLVRGEDVEEILPLVAKRASHPSAQIRSTAAWVMGDASHHKAFQKTLIGMLNDPAPVVRRNAAVALARHGRSEGRPILRSMLVPYAVRAPVSGILRETVGRDSLARSGYSVARIETEGRTETVRAPLDGRVRKIEARIGRPIAADDVILRIDPTDAELTASLVALLMIGIPEDVAAVDGLLQSSMKLSDAVRTQARYTIRQLKARAGQ